MEPSEGLPSGACDGEAKAVPEMAQEVEAPVEPGREHGREMQAVHAPKSVDRAKRKGRLDPGRDSD